MGSIVGYCLHSTLSDPGNSLSDTHLQFLCNFMKPSPAMDHSPEISLLGLLQLEYLDLSNNHIMNIDPLLPLLEHTNCKLRLEYRYLRNRKWWYSPEVTLTNLVKASDDLKMNQHLSEFVLC